MRRLLMTKVSLARLISWTELESTQTTPFQDQTALLLNLLFFSLCFVIQVSVCDTRRAKQLRRRKEASWKWRQHLPRRSR